MGLATPATGDHLQGNATRGIQFDHRTGNEWWVEVMLGGRDSGSVSKVEAMDDGGAWTLLTKRSWGAWAGSFHIEPGHRVAFRATWPDGVQVPSCWFTHPGGVEHCESDPAPGFDASFTGVRGNEWWVQANVAANGAVSAVDVTLDKGATWKPLAKQSWGGWAASYRIVQGTVLQLRATAGDGQTDLSSCRQWIPASGQDAQVVACPGTGGFDATFTGVKGNEWWVQVNVAGNQPVASVVARVDCASDWMPLQLQSWGAWAASFHIPAGAKVDFQARTSTWTSDVSGGYTWTAATPTSGCPQGDWPRQGSFATYDLDSGVCGGGECFHNDARMMLTYDKGRWLGRCAAQDRHTAVDGTVSTRDWSSEHVGLPPSWESPRTSIGATHQPDMFRAGYGADSCSMGWTSSPVIVHAVETVTVDFESQDPRDIDAWSAASRDEVDNLYTTHWDQDTGLVLEIHSNPRRSGQGGASMVLVDSDVVLR